MALLAKEDYDGATRAAREVLQLHHDSLPAFHILAEASEKQNRPDTVAWRAQIARLQPDNLDSQLNLASAALRFGRLDTARKALEMVPPAQRDRASYHIVAGWLARAQGNDADVETHFAAAVSQEPTNDLYQFNLAVLRIRSPAPEKSDEARKVLERLSKLPAYRAGSLRDSCARLLGAVSPTTAAAPVPQLHPTSLADGSTIRVNPAKSEPQSPACPGLSGIVRDNSVSLLRSD